MPARGHVVLIGLMGAGKTTVGQLLAARLDRPFIDNDERLRRRTGLTARELAASEGVDGLHRLEADALLDALSSSRPAVVAAAAAAVLEPRAARALRDNTVVYLRVDPSVLGPRLLEGDDDAHRPYEDLPRVVREQFDARDDAYQQMSDVVVGAAMAPDAVVDAIISALAR